MADPHQRATMAELPWWLTGDQLCEHCLGEYSLDIGYFCQDCDGPICAHCVIVVRESQEVFCPGCRDAP